VGKLKTFVIFILLLFSIFLFNIVSIFGFLVQVPRKLIRRESLEEYFFTCAIGEDQRGGSYLYGTEDYTISSYTYYLSAKGNIYARGFKRFIDFFALLLGEKEHCKKSFEKEEIELKNGGAKFNKIK